MVVLCGSGGLRAGNVGCENERVATANPQASRMLTATRLCGDQVGEYQARTDRGKHSSGSLEEASTPQPKTPGPSFLYHLSWQLLHHSYCIIVPSQTWSNIRQHLSRWKKIANDKPQN
jgi:hypothetical protein